MKNILVVILLALVFTVHSSTSSIAQEKNEHQHKNEKTGLNTKQDTAPTSQIVDGKVAASIKEIVEHYLQLKNALVNDNSKNAAATGKEMVAVFDKLDKNSLSPDQKKFFEDIEEDAREQAEHISDNAGKLDHQREHFDMLSIDIYDLVKKSGAGQVLYKVVCSMYNDKKGAFWLSESKTIKNPYYGKKMLNCGTVEEEIK